MKEFIMLMLLVLAVVTSCSSEDNVAEFEGLCAMEEICEESISRYVASMAGVTAATAQINGSMVVVGLDLDGELNDGQLTTLKRRIIHVIKDASPDFKHVAVTTTLDLYNKLIKPEGVDCCHQILEEDELFEIVVPTL
ncbi:MAG: YhcN/YlaJ family sporulation lipoprotein [Defluviitaleaceae bacterium]|nr:YhcN/YlaJ family sporulation lipoprotein [Defluviitaleaceae bacterium]